MKLLKVHIIPRQHELDQTGSLTNSFMMGLFVVGADGVYNFTVSPANRIEVADGDYMGM